MNYQDFLQDIQVRISSRIDENVTLQIRKINKNNGNQYDALILIQQDLNISPTIYLTPYYHRYLDGVNIEEICDDIWNTYRTHRPQDNFDISRFTDYEKAQSHIVFRLVNQEQNKELLKQIPHTSIADLALIYYCMLDTEDNQIGSILIYNQHLKTWGITLCELHQTALHNTPVLMPFEHRSMYTYLQEVFPGDDIDSHELSKAYILTNKQHLNGATALFYPGVLEYLENIIQSDFIIIPSSIHEVILLPTDSPFDSTHLNLMIQEVNETQLCDEEVLSDHYYFYSRERGLLWNE